MSGERRLDADRRRFLPLKRHDATPLQNRDSSETLLIRSLTLERDGG